MNATASRAARHLVRRCLVSRTDAMAGSNHLMTSNAARARASSYSLISESRWSTTTTFRFFATKSGGEGGDEPGDSTPENDTSSSDNIIPPVVDLDSHSNADAYDPFEITKSFGDTSYYYPPSEETDPGYLAQKYEGMTNEELVDSSTIDPVTDPHTSTNHTWDSLMHSPPVRDKNAALPKGTLVGTVVSTKMQKTVNVAVDRYKVHPKYRKRIRYTRKFMAHDENEVASDGDLVLIVPSQKISKKKHFVLREILKAKGQL